MHISACIVMYGGADETLRCIKSLAANTKEDDLTVYVVDNASPDNALKQVQSASLPKNVALLPQRKNRGFGTGHNAVLPLLASQYHVLSNPDIEIHSEVLAGIARYMAAHSDVAMVCPRLVFPNGKEQHIAKRRPALMPLVARQIPLSFLKKYESHYLMLDEDLSRPINVEFCSGSFFMMRTDVFQKMGGFDEDYFMYVEDADITQKALAYGRAVYLPQFTVTHAWHRDAHKKPRQFFWQLKSMARYFKKWGFRFK